VCDDGSTNTPVTPFFLSLARSQNINILQSSLAMHSGRLRSGRLIQQCPTVTATRLLPPATATPSPSPPQILTTELHDNLNSEAKRTLLYCPPNDTDDDTDDTSEEQTSKGCSTYSAETLRKDATLLKSLSLFQDCVPNDVGFGCAKIMDYVDKKIIESIASFNDDLGHTLCKRSVKCQFLPGLKRLMLARNIYNNSDHVKLSKMIYRHLTSNSIPNCGSEPFTLFRSDIGYILSLAPQGSMMFNDLKYLLCGVGTGFRKGSLDHQVFSHILIVNRITDKDSPEFGLLEVNLVVPFRKNEIKLDESRKVWIIGNPNAQEDELNAPDFVSALNACCLSQTGLGLEEFFANQSVRGEFSNVLIAPLVNGMSLQKYLRKMALYAGYPSDWKYSTHGSIRRGFAGSAAGNIQAGLASLTLDEAGDWDEAYNTAVKYYNANDTRLTRVYMNRLGDDCLEVTNLSARRVPYSTISRDQSDETFRHAVISENHPGITIRFKFLADIVDYFSQDGDLLSTSLDAIQSQTSNSVRTSGDATDATQAMILCAIIVLNKFLVFRKESRTAARIAILSHVRGLSRPAMTQWICSNVLKFATDGHQTYQYRIKAWNLEEFNEKLKAEEKNSFTVPGEWIEVKHCCTFFLILPYLRLPFSNSKSNPPPPLNSIAYTSPLSSKQIPLR